jgi:hypothetical protein
MKLCKSVTRYPQKRNNPFVVCDERGILTRRNVTVPGRNEGYRVIVQDVGNSYI